MLNFSIKNKSLLLFSNLTKESSPFYLNNLNNKKMIKSGSSKKSKIKLNNSVLNCKRYPNNKFKDMLICKTQVNLINSFLLILSLTVFFKIDKLYQEPFLPLNKSLDRKRAENKLK